MLSIEIIAIGRLKPEEAKLEARYLERLQKAGPSAGLKHIQVKECPESKQATASKRQQDETAKLVKNITPKSLIIALDETGQLQTSKNLATKLGKLKDEGQQTISFVLGGPDGHSQELKHTAHQSLSLSKLTLPHGLARILLLEQLYRTTTLWQGHPYHRD